MSWKPPQGQSAAWERLMLTEMTAVVPSGWTNSVTETPGATGITNLNITATGAGILPFDSVIWHTPLDRLVSDEFSIEFFIEMTNATSGAGGYGSAQADGIYFYAGIASDITDVATYAAFVGFDHDRVSQPEALVNKAGTNTYASSSNSTRHFRGCIFSGKNYIQGDRGYCSSYNFTKEPLNFVAQLTNNLPAAATTDSLSLVVCAGRDAAGSYNIPVRIWYYLAPKLGLT